MNPTARLGAIMEGEMAEQPEVLRRLLARRGSIEADLTHGVPRRPIGVILAARGTSDNAATYGRYLLEMALGVPVALAAPSLSTRYGCRTDLAGWLLVALSQSGRTPEIERVVRSAAGAGATTVAITNEADSPLAEAADRVVALAAGPERAVPATKTFTAELAAIAILTAALSRREVAGLERIETLARLQESALEDPEPARRLVPGLADARAVIALGSGPLLALAQEAALKLGETTAFPVLAYSANDFLHGPVAAAGPTVPVVCFAAPGPVEADVEAAAAAAAERGAPVIWVAEKAWTGDCEWLPTPPGVPEPLAALVHAVRAQQLALELSRILGLDPDVPRGLTKVTST